MDQRDDLVGNRLACLLACRQSGKGKKGFYLPSIVAGARAGAGRSEVVF